MNDLDYQNESDELSSQLNICSDPTNPQRLACALSPIQTVQKCFGWSGFFKKNLFLGRVFLKSESLIIEIDGLNKGQHPSWPRMIFFGLQTSLIFLIVFFFKRDVLIGGKSLCLAMLDVYEMRGVWGLWCGEGGGVFWIWWVGVQAQEMRPVVITIGQCQQNPSDQITHQTIIPSESFSLAPSLLKLQILIPKLTISHH